MKIISSFTRIGASRSEIISKLSFFSLFFLSFFLQSDVSFHTRVERVWNILRYGKNLETASLVRLKQREQNSNYPDRRRIFASKELAFLARWRVLRKRIEEETKLKIICFFAPNTLVASDYFYLSRFQRRI